MDINTERGQKALRDERYLAEWVEDRFDVKWIETPKNQFATVDALLLWKNELKYVVEVKCRYDMDLARLMTVHNGEWLVTWDKVWQTMEIGKALGIQALGILYMPNTQEVIVQKLSTENGFLIPDIRLSTTVTQATTNGGQAKRVNAYINIKDAQRYSI